MQPTWKHGKENGELDVWKEKHGVYWLTSYYSEYIIQLFGQQHKILYVF